MKRTRPWLYFVFFLVTLAALSTFRETLPDLYGQYALVAATVWISGVIVLSAVTLYRHGRSTDSKDHGGFGMAGLPLPRSWKRWIYDEHEKKNLN
jgi:hypothetical protein